MTSHRRRSQSTPGQSGLAEQGTMVLLVFRLGAHRFAVIADQVREIVRAVAVAALPHAPPVVEGVINYRETIVPVVDIRQPLALPPNPLHPDQHFLVAQAGPRLVALRVDRATEVLPVDRSAIAPATAVVPGVEPTLGIATLPDGLLVIHDLEGFLALGEAEQLDHAMRHAGASARPPRVGGAA